MNMPTVLESLVSDTEHAVCLKIFYSSCVLFYRCVLHLVNLYAFQLIVKIGCFWPYLVISIKVNASKGVEAKWPKLNM